MKVLKREMNLKFSIDSVYDLCIPWQNLDSKDAMHLNHNEIIPAASQLVRSSLLLSLHIRTLTV